MILFVLEGGFHKKNHRMIFRKSLKFPHY